MNGQAKDTIFRNIFLCCLLLPLIGCSSGEEEKKEQGLSEEEVQALSETMGHMVYETLHDQQMNIDLDSLIFGIEDARGGNTAPLSKEEFQEMLKKFRQHLHNVKGAENLKIAEDFLSENIVEPNVVSMKSGKVQYRVLEEGQGAVVHEQSAPLLNYEGRLIDGTVFDSTRLRNGPVKLSLKSTIPGFQLGVAGMKEGEKRRLFIHPGQGFGMDSRLPPNSLLIFDIEVVKAESSQQSAQKPPKREEKPEEARAQHPSTSHAPWMSKIREAVF